ncbi:MAG TPA: hypothetical protein VN611_04035 [Patescibacteria group bacterium]|nr:hypothetical protein [Patescibacteria group bacterium]
MKLFKNGPNFVAVLLIAIGFFFALGYGYYKNAVAKEQTSGLIAVAEGSLKSDKPIIFELNDQGLPKKWLQPNKVLISNFLIKNDGDKPLEVQVNTITFANEVLLESGAPGFQKPTTELTRTIAPGKTLRVKARINLAELPVNQIHLQRLGEIQVSNKQTGQILARTPVDVRNSAVAAEECPDMNESGDSSGQHDAHHKP